MQHSLVSEWAELRGFQFEAVVEGNNNPVKSFRDNSENVMAEVKGGQGPTWHNQEMRVSDLWDVCGRQSPFVLVYVCVHICEFGI